jgi:hypothetical protein
MKKLILMTTIVLLISGCGVSWMNGHFYVKNTSFGYIVEADGNGFSVEISKPMTFSEATQLCDKLNKDLGDNASLKGSQ